MTTQLVSARSVATTGVIARAAILWLVAVIVGGIAYFRPKMIVWSVVGPLLACAVLTFAFVTFLRWIEDAVPYFEIGVFYAVIVFIYCAFPLLQYIANGYSFPENADARLILTQHRPEALGALSWWYVVYLACFCVAYVLARGRRPTVLPLNVPQSDASTLAAIAILLIGASAFFAVLGWFYDMSTSSYLEQYLVIQRLPPFVRQVAAHVRVMSLNLEVMLVIALCCARRRRYNLILAAFLAWTVISRVVWPHARLELFSILLAAIAAYHLVVRRIPFRWAAAGALTAFIALLALGPIRASRSLQDVRSQMSVQTEFSIIFGNAVDLKYLQNLSGGFLAKPNLYWSGVLAMVPQQLMPIAKDTPAEWYARGYYPEYYRTGGGLAFGVLAEAVMGFGIWEVVWRGALIGALFGLLHRTLGRGRVSLALLMFYLWMIVWCYQTVRTGTFALLMFVVYHFLTPLLGITVLAAMLRRGRRAARSLAAPPRAANPI